MTAQQCEACPRWGCVRFEKRGSTHWFCLSCWFFTRPSMMEAKS